MQNKNSIRKNIIARLKRLKSLTGFEKQNSLINRRVQNELQNRHGIWAAFMPLSTEPNLQETYRAFDGQIQFAFPKAVGRDIHFYLSPHDSEFQKGCHGILEPDHQNSLRVLAGDLAGVLVPGVAFDSVGNRLGRGRAFYDRFLKTCTAQKIGVCFQTQYLNSVLKTQNHDEKVDQLMTDCFRLSFSLSGFSERKFV